ncbi:LuxR C-terminal-related transcriptional regulator [Marmoricola sp. URHB0036]|uniref:LuxR C-terminal-related transcriptional regulator n=1 Tax=Marmoricola sp. URHB0036 TaxID=1298863 RepID=UPI00040083E5|nr:LuxR C-terminal-related transcriptional regulator [Marmoricola sp. URHB0036]
MATTRTSVQLRAKLQVPIAAGDLIDRARLRERLDTLVGPGEGACVLAVCAPAGFGKTTAVSVWARGLDPARVKVAWCSLDATESHTFRFWSLVLQAVTSARPELAGAGLAAPHRAGAMAFLNELAEALADRQLVLVLENLHELVDPKVLADLDQFVGLLPASVKLVLTSRSDPPLTALQGLHLRGELIRLRVRDLAFTIDELRQLAPGLDEEKRQLIWERTDGWPALVSLMLLSLRTDADLPLAPVEDDYVMAEYLFRELLRRQDPRVQSLMLVAGVPDLLPLDLAVQLSGMTDAGRVLEGLVASSGLVTRSPATPDGQPWYRFHPLLRSYLRAELARSDRQREHRLHTRAADWFLDAGLPLEAVRHARASENTAVVERVVAAVGMGLVNAGEASLLLDSLAGSSGRPSPSGPWTHVVAAAALTDLGRASDARGELALARAGSSETEIDSDLEETWRGVDRHLRRRRGLPVELDEQEGPLATSPDVQVYAAVERGGAMLATGDSTAATLVLDAAADLAEGLGRPAALVDTLGLLALARAACSDYRGVGPYLDRAFAIAREHGWGASPRLANAHLLRAWCARLRMEDGVARWHASRARTLLDGSSDPGVAAAVLLLDQVIAFEADPRAFTSAGEVHDVWAGAETRRTPALVVHAALVDARISLMLHRVDRVQETAEAVRRSVGECGEVRLIDAMVDGATGRRRQALDAVRQVSGGQVQVVTPVSRLIAASLETRLAMLEEDTFGATRAARQALELADQFDAPRAIVDFGGEEMLTLLQQERGRWGTHEVLAERIAGSPRPTDTSPEVLTARELEVLVELPTLRTVEEIAHSMFVSVNTLKTHLRSVYRKLGVSSRRDAVTAARVRGLL